MHAHIEAGRPPRMHTLRRGQPPPTHTLFFCLEASLVFVVFAVSIGSSAAVHGSCVHRLASHRT